MPTVTRLKVLTEHLELHRLPPFTDSPKTPLSSPIFQGIVPEPMRNAAKEAPPLNERDRKAADDWMRDHMPDPDGYSFERFRRRVATHLIVVCQDHDA